VTRLLPVPRTGPRPEGALPLAGSRHVWFDRVVRDGQAVVLTALAPAAVWRLSAPRPDLCGLTLGRPRIMGILNVTPDSFSDGGNLASVADAVARARALQADILDIGGESTRPGAGTVSVAEEIRRTVPVIAALREAGLTTPISIDTRKAPVAEAALDAGADMVNDVSALTFDPDLASLVAERGVPVCLMHARGDPATMQIAPHYDDVVAEVLADLAERVAAALAAGIAKHRLIVDPGIGFGKTLRHNVTLLRALAALHDLGLPVLLGASRKSFIGTIGGAEVPSERLPGSLAVALHGASQAMQILRVHDTSETRQALSLHLALIGNEDGQS